MGNSKGGVRRKKVILYDLARAAHRLKPVSLQLCTVAIAVHGEDLRRPAQSVEAAAPARRFPSAQSVLPIVALQQNAGDYRP
jgi:hypothetical protein